LKSSFISDNPSGRGSPPARMVWFDVPTVLATEEPPENWTLNRPGANEWELVHDERDERLFLVVE